MVQETQAPSISPSVVPIAIPRISYEDFLTSYDGTRAEWVDGEVVLLSPASRQHQLVSDFLTALLKVFAETRSSGIVMSAPFQMKTGDQLPGREPDILFIADEHRDRIRNTYVAGPADLVVEIISPDSLVRDRGEKFSEYERGGVREYWLLDPIRKVADFYHLDGGVYRPARVGDDGRYESAVLPGFWLRIDWLWQEPTPPLLSIFKELGLVP